MTSLNQTLFDKSQQLIPGGVNSPVRAFRSVGGTPIFFKKGLGSKLWDVDGKEYIDYINSWGPMIVGHAHPEVIAAVQAAAANSLSFGAPTGLELEMAELINKLVPSMEQVRLNSSGTEATMSAIRTARGFTGRDTIVKFEGCYHGHSDGLLVKAGSGLLTFGEPDSGGVPASVAAHTLTLEYNNTQQLKDLFDKTGDEIACVIIEPVVGNMNLIVPTMEFLQTLRARCGLAVGRQRRCNTRSTTSSKRAELPTRPIDRLPTTTRSRCAIQPRISTQTFARRTQTTTSPTRKFTK